MSEIQKQLESFLIADCGSTTTKVALLDTVDGQYRFVAYAESPSTVSSPWEDVSVGLLEAIHRLEETTGRTLLDEEDELILPERADGSGVDRFLATSSAAPPLRVILVGLTYDVSLASARRAALATYTQIEDVIALEQDSSRHQPRDDNDKFDAIWHKSPDLLLIVGGTDGGNAAPVLEMVQNVVRVALYLMGDNVPLVIYAGNDQIREQVTQQIGEYAPLEVVDNVRPFPDVENIAPAHEEIEVAFYDQKVRTIPGISMLSEWGASTVLPTARAADYAIRYCEHAFGSSKVALGVDIGSTSVTINVCRDGQSLTTVRNDLGVGYGLSGVLEQVEMQDIVRWLPFEISESQVRDRLMNKALRPHSIPQTREDLLLEQAAAREALRLALKDSLPGWPAQSDMLLDDMLPPCEPIIASGGVLTHTPYHGYAALMLLDALQPVGITEIYLDEYNLISALGMVSTVEPLAMVQILGGGGLTFLGTAVTPVGQAQPGEKVLTIRPVDKTSSIRSEVTYGNLEAIPFQFFTPGTTLELLPNRRFDIGHGPGKSCTIQYKGGTVGLIVDARGRPLELERDPEMQRQRMDHWLWEMMSA
jgi:hypothetical protein